MAIGKWIGGALGWILSGSMLGGLVGYCIGTMLDEAFAGDNRGGIGRTDMASKVILEVRVRLKKTATPFLFSMLVLSSYIIKADGKIMHSEMEYVRQFLRHNFGEQAVSQGESILLKLFDLQKQQGPYQFKETIRKSCVEIRFHTSVSQRLQLLNYLVIIAKADGIVSPEEVAALKEIAQYIGLSAQDVESMLNLESGAKASSNIEDAYKVLGISPSATDDEVKAAYRKMALKHHPDRVSTLGDDIRKVAEKKFQEINDAKERIYKARGL